MFENDRIKYDIYEDSLYRAFLDKKKYGRFLQTKAPAELATENHDISMVASDCEVTVMYFGAGRGPLIRKAIKAAERA